MGRAWRIYLVLGKLWLQIDKSLNLWVLVFFSGMVTFQESCETQMRSCICIYMQNSESEVKVSQSCPTFCHPMDCIVHGLLQTRILEWVAFPFSRGSSQPRGQTQVSPTAGGFFTSWATREAQKLVSKWRNCGSGYGKIFTTLRFLIYCNNQFKKYITP